MRSEGIRSAGAYVAVLILASGLAPRLLAAEMPRPAGPRIVLPELPPVQLRLLDTDPAGALGGQPRAASASRAPVPPALTLEDGGPALASAPRIDPLPTGAIPGSSRPTPPLDAPAAGGSAAPPVTAPPAIARDETVPPSPEPAMTRLLASFAARGVLGDTAAQGAERRAVREQIASFYAGRGGAPLWIVDGRFGPAARAALARLDHAAEDGLDLGATPVPVPPAGADAGAQAAADLALSEAVVSYARQAEGSRVDLGRLGGIIDFRPAVPPADRILSTVSGAADAGEALRAFNPPQPGYAALRDKLAGLRQANPPEAGGRIAAGPVLKPGMSDARVPLIRARFGLDVAKVEPGVPPLVYDTQVAGAVADFQRAHGLPASGLLTPRTVAALSGGNPVRLENTIIANMELWRALPRDEQPDRIEVNIPDYTARVLRDGQVVHETRVVVGQPDKPTPVFAEQMRFIIVNPYWNVPLSIIKNEMMPKLAADPNYFANHGYEVVQRDGTTYVRQPPGEGNALGRIKFMFPNSHSVYLHDTNARSYFARDMRALSHGCVRVEEPFSFAEAVLGRQNGWSEARVRKLIGGQERTIALPKPLPILITYFTAFVDPQRGFQLRDDVYGYAGRIKLALALQD